MVIDNYFHSLSAAHSIRIYPIYSVVSNILDTLEYYLLAFQFNIISNVYHTNQINFSECTKTQPYQGYNLRIAFSQMTNL